MNEKQHTLWSKISYGFADIYGGGAFVIISTFFTVFLTKAQGMPVAMAGTIPLIGKVWDAVTDPIMGNIADRTRSKYGAKRFYILVGAFLSAITFILMWMSLSSASMGTKYLFYALMYMLFSTGFTIVMVPYNGLLPDMIEDYTERAKYSSIRMIFSTFGAILAGLIPTLLIKDNTNAAQYFKVALIFGVIFTVSILLTFAGTWEKQKEPIKVSFAESFTQSFTVYKSRAFRLFIGIFLAGQGAADFVTGLAVYYVDDVLNAYGGGNFTILMGVLLIAQFLGTIAFAPVVQKKGKTFPILFAFPIRIAATLALLFVSKEGANFTVILILSFIIGLGMAASSTSIYAILSDMADVDELITSISRPGTVSGMATFIRKIATGLSSAVIGLLLAMIKYDEVAASAGERQTLAVQNGIKYIYVFVPVLLMALTLYFAKIFPLHKKEFDIIKMDIERHKGNELTKVSVEDRAVIESVTGFKYEDLWNRDNALKLKGRK